MERRRLRSDHRRIVPIVNRDHDHDHPSGASGPGVFPESEGARWMAPDGEVVSQIKIESDDSC